MMDNLRGISALSSVEARAGNIASNTGNEMAAPAPRKNVRRGMDFLNINTVRYPPRLE